MNLKLMEFHGFQWLSMENSMKFHGIRWNSMDFHGIPWIYGIWWNSVSTGLPHELATNKVYDQVTPPLFHPSLMASFFYLTIFISQIKLTLTFQKNIVAILAPRLVVSFSYIFVHSIFVCVCGCVRPPYFCLSVCLCVCLSVRPCLNRPNYAYYLFIFTFQECCFYQPDPAWKSLFLSVCLSLFVMRISHKLDPISQFHFVGIYNTVNWETSSHFTSIGSRIMQR
jgi:hypothetical protein